MSRGLIPPGVVWMWLRWRQLPEAWNIQVLEVVRNRRAYLVYPSHVGEDPKSRGDEDTTP